jgi:hypothetical protein
MIPSKADPEEQKAWKEEQLDPRLEEAKSGQRALIGVRDFFMSRLLARLLITIDLSGNNVA